MIDAKYIVLKEMLKKRKNSLAEEYLKKILLTFSGNTELVSGLILAYSKLVRKYYEDLKGV